ncbi:MAG: Rho termination factor N-terminal domain-containing protein [Hungatella sp.]
MRLIRGNVERVAETEEQAARLEAQGFEEIGCDPEMKREKKMSPLSGMKVDELKVLAEEKGIEGYASLTKEELLAVLKDVV